MELAFKNNELPVLMVYDMDSAWASHEIAETVGETCRLIAGLRRVGHSVIPLPVTDANLAGQLERFDPAKYIVFNWCEGFPGVDHSDDAVAHTLDSLQFTYTGASGEVLALSRDKRKVKELLCAQNLPTPAWQIVPVKKTPDWSVFPAIVKPADEHCSLGVTSKSVVLNQTELKEQVEAVHQRFHQSALIEEFIDGREFHVTLWGNGAIEMLPPAEMDFSDCKEIQERLCSYDSKFIPSSESYQRIQSLIPAPLAEAEKQELERICAAGYRALGCRDYARLDLRLRDGIFYVLDINPNSDISKDASFGCAAKVAGYSYGAMGSRIVQLAAHRHPVFGLS